MFKRIFAFLALAFALFGPQSWAQESVPCTSNGGITCTFSPTQTTHTYQFGDGSRLTVQFITVLTTFTLHVTVTHPTDSTCEVECGPSISLDPKEFPPNTVCVQYPTNGPGVCDQYDFSGFSGGPNGVPVKNKDYKGLITLTLTYDTFQTVHNPAFGHAPGDITTFTEDILTIYSEPFITDPTMGGKIPGLSSVVALDEPLTESDSGCLTLTPTNNPSEQKPQVEVALKVASGLNNLACTGTGIRDKTARLSVALTDPSTGDFISFPPLKNVEGNKFHWDSKNGLNEYDISTEGLLDGRYTVTVFSSKFSPQSASFCLLGGSFLSCL